MKRVVLALLCAVAMSASPARAAEITSAYTDFPADIVCAQLSAYEAGASFSCPGYMGYGVVFSEGDLRQSIFYGYVGSWYAEGAWESFGPFNSAGTKIEWRLHDGVPKATILRWIIENSNPQTGEIDPARRGEILVVSRVAQPGEGEACVIGYVDARANTNANDLARDLADTQFESFRCRVDEPVYHGEQGPFAEPPVRSFGP